MHEILFVIKKEKDGGYMARAVGESIFTEAESLTALRESMREAVRCHFDEGHAIPEIREELIL